MRIRLFAVLIALVLSASVYSIDLDTLGSVGIYCGRPSYVAVPTTYEEGWVTWTTTSVLRLASGQAVLLITKFYELNSILSKIEPSNFPNELEVIWQEAFNSEQFYSVSTRVLFSLPNRTTSKLYSEWAGYLLSIPEDVWTLHLYDEDTGKTIYAGPVSPVEYENVLF